MSRINETTLRKYLVTLLETPRIKSFIEQLDKKRNRQFVKFSKEGTLEYPRMLFMDRTYQAVYAGVAHSSMSMDIAKWILQDADEAKGVVRHELAHLLHCYSGVGGNAHGKEFRSVLKIISPRTWRRDRHWHPNPEIEKARLKVHPKSNRMSTVKIGGRYYRSR